MHRLNQLSQKIGLTVKQPTSKKSNISQNTKLKDKTVVIK